MRDAGLGSGPRRRRQLAVCSGDLTVVIAGLDPAIHLLRQMMDARVKPAHDVDRAAYPA
jgi:hypothetical protein